MPLYFNKNIYILIHFNVFNEFSYYKIILLVPKK